MIKRAREKGILDIKVYNIRDYSSEKRKRVDDRTLGGGPGMVLMAPPLIAALRELKKEGSHVVYLSPQGKALHANKCRELAQHRHLILVCGHYEGMDERVMEWVDEEISIGDFVLTSGAPAAVVCVDAIARFLPGFFEKTGAAERDSFEQGIFDYPHYTHPVEFENKRVPTVLLEGDHKKIAAWRRKAALKKTAEKRPDLFLLYMASTSSRPEGEEIEGCLGATLVVKDLASSVAFYRKVLRFPIVEETEDGAVFAVGKSFLTLREGGGEMMGVGKRVIFTIEIGDVPFFQQTLSRLKKAGRVVGQIEQSCIQGEGLKNLDSKSLPRVAFTDVDDHPWVLCLTDMNLMVRK